MSSPLRIVVCVCALTHAELLRYWNDIPADIRALLDAGNGDYAVAEKGKVYGDKRDDWSPFSNGTSVLRYLTDVGFRKLPVSDNLDDLGNPARKQELLNRVQLYIFDPLFVVLQRKNAAVVELLQGMIGSSGKNFCILIPNRMPADLRERLIAVCSSKLDQLKLAYADEGRGEWEAEKALRLTSYLHRVARYGLVMQPSPGQQAGMDALMPGVRFRENPLNTGGEGP